MTTDVFSPFVQPSIEAPVSGKDSSTIPGTTSTWISGREGCWADGLESLSC